MSLDGKRRTIREVLDFYGSKRCVVSGQLDDEVEYHHLDEDSGHWVFENVVPLKSGFNQAIDSHRKRNRGRKWPSAIHDELRSAKLLDRAVSHLNGHSRPASYGCSRLGCFIGIHHENELDTAVRCAIHALYSVRPTSHLCLAADTLQRSILNGVFDINPSDVPNVTWAGLAKEIGCYYLEFGLPKEFPRCERLIASLISDEESREASVTRLRTEQHHAFNLLKQGKLAEGKDRLDEITQRMLDINYPTGPSNNWQHFLAAQVDAGRIDAAAESVERIEESVGKIEPLKAEAVTHGNQIHAGRVTLWTYRGLLFRKADLWLLLGPEYEATAFSFVENARDMGEISGIRTTGMLPSKALKRFSRKYNLGKQIKCQRCRTLGFNFFGYASEILLRLEGLVGTIGTYT